MFHNAVSKLLRMWSKDVETPSRAEGKQRRRKSGLAFLESLERRELLTASGPYALSGFTWAQPTHLTYSIAPDGVWWDHGVNNLNAVFNAKFGVGVWEAQIARAVATWESVANVDITLVHDSYKDENAIGLPQGDPSFGDIRIGGYAYANDTTTLAQTYFPPPNGSTAPGDVEINTTMNFGIGSGYDLYSVVLHELGHSMGLDHVTNPVEVMYPNYNGIRDGLSPGDIAGVQAMYGQRTPDGFQAAGRGLNFGNAVDVSGMINGSGGATVGGLSLYTQGDTEFFSMVAPSGANGPLVVTAVGSGYSMLSPKISLYDANGNLIDSQAKPGGWSTNTSAMATGVTPGQRYYVTVSGASKDAFSVGTYALNVAFSTSPTPAPSPPPVYVPTAPVFNNGVANISFSTATRLGVVSQVYVPNQTLPSGVDAEYFIFRNARAGVFVVSANGAQVQVVDAYGNVVASGVGQVAVRIYRPRSTLYVEVSSPNGNGIGSYGLGIAPASPASATIVKRRARREVAVAREVTLTPSHRVIHSVARNLHGLHA